MDIIFDPLSIHVLILKNDFPTEPRPVLTVSPSWLSAGASVTLNCRVKDQSAGWRFYWYKTVPDPSDNFYSYELLPGSSSGTEQDSYIVDGQTHTAGYVCRAGRGDPVFYTDYSQPQFVWSAGQFFYFITSVYLFSVCDEQMFSRYWRETDISSSVLIYSFI